MCSKCFISSEFHHMLLKSSQDNEGPDSQDSQDSWSGWSFMLPNPRLLVWDKIVQYPLNYSTGPANYTIFNGWLKVSLVPCRYAIQTLGFPSAGLFREKIQIASRLK